MNLPASDSESIRLMLYLCVRWGHAESPEGFNGEDTSYIVRAMSHDQAAKLADQRLKWLPRRVPGEQRGVEDRCHFVVQLGMDHATSGQPVVLAGPYIGYQRGAVWSMDEASNYPCWTRNDLTTGQGDRWIDQAALDAIYGRTADTTDSQD